MLNYTSVNLHPGVLAASRLPIRWVWTTRCRQDICEQAEVVEVPNERMLRHSGGVLYPASLFSADTGGHRAPHGGQACSSNFVPGAMRTHRKDPQKEEIVRS